MAGNDTSPPIVRPIPRRTFELTPSSPESSCPPTPPSATESFSNAHLSPNGKAVSNDQPPSRTRSILNLTSSTLFGIYSPTGYNSGENREEPSTPWGTGALTPSPRIGDTVPPSPRLALLNWENYPSLGLRGDQTEQRRPSSSHHAQHLGFTNFFLPLAVRTFLLFMFGVAYGTIITHLHDDSRIVPVKIEGMNHHDWRYLVFWGVAGIGLGSLLPWVDLMWETRPLLQPSTSAAASRDDKAKCSAIDDRPSSASGLQPATPSPSPLSADWTPVVRSIGAFVGIAFAIVRPRARHALACSADFPERKLPWQSTLQVSLTLALVNPVLWYLLDRSKPGFLLSALVGLSGTTVLSLTGARLLDTPAGRPSPGAGPGLVRGKDGIETLAVGTWVASVLFCSCVCFGSVGRRLASSGSANPSTRARV